MAQSPVNRNINTAVAGVEMHRKITGLITPAKLDAIIAEYRSVGNDAA